jgi:hypothetical protein
MRKALLKISSLLLCGLLIYNSLGYFLVLTVIRVAERHQKWAQLSAIPDQQLTPFVFDNANPGERLKILDEGEILVDGKLYDVVRKTTDGKRSKYLCVHDREEETLIAKTREFNSQTQPLPVQNTARLIFDKIIKTGIFDANTNKSFKNYTVIHSLIIEKQYSVPTIQISIPPPQQCC